MLAFVASLTALAVFYFCDKDFNHGELLHELVSVLHTVSHGTF
jgi:hypothetical protein